MSQIEIGKLKENQQHVECNESPGGGFKSKAKRLEIFEVMSNKLEDKKLGSVVRKAKGKDIQCKAVKVEIPEF